jgi:protein-disulfide isomerase
MPEEQNLSKASVVKSTLGVPIAIVIAALVIAVAIIYSGSQNGTQVGNPSKQVAQETAEVEVAPVTDKDHILGNPNAPIMIVEYSDYDCPYCRIFHDTMTKIMAEYGESGKVAWVFRHFPLAQLHPNAHTIAEASECVASIGGNDAFWKFTNALNDSRKIEYSPEGQLKSVEPTNVTRLSEFAETAGVSKTAYTQCMDSGKFVEAITEDVAEALKTGGRGTPYSFLIAGDQQGPINGAQPYTVVKGMIDTVLSQIGS